MRKAALIVSIMSVLFINQAASSDKTKDANQLFYKANSFYEKGDYAKAVESYIAILDMGLEGGNIYYNIGNGFLKLGKIGYAILCYEKARRFMPGDSDLKANLNYTRSLVDDTGPQVQSKNIIIRLIERPFGDYSLNTLAILGAAFYVIVIVLSSIFIVNPVFARKFKALFLVTLVILLITLAAFAMRYHNEEWLKEGIVIQKEAESKYEPIDKSTTYYTLHEGDRAIVLQTRNGWRQIKRLDGKIAWVKKEAIEEI